MEGFEKVQNMGESERILGKDRVRRGTGRAKKNKKQSQLTNTPIPSEKATKRGRTRIVFPKGFSKREKNLLNECQARGEPKWDYTKIEEEFI